MGTRWLAATMAGATLLAATMIGTAPSPARAALTNVWPASADGDIYPTLSTTDALFAYVTSDFRGGRVCIVPASGAGSCDSPAWGSPNVLIGIGTLFTLIEGPTLQAGTYRLMTESPRPAGQSGWDPGAYSDVFTIEPCEATNSCFSTVGRDEANRFKAANRRLGEYTAKECQAGQPDSQEEAADTIKAGVKALASRSSTKQTMFIVSFGGGLAAGALGLLEIESYNDAAKQILMMLQCEVARMYEDIANDPPDPVYATVQAPVFTAPEATGRPVVDELAAALDAQAAYGIAARIAFERAQGAEAAGDPVAQQLQLDAVAEFTTQLATAGRRTVVALRAAAVSGDPAFAGTPVATAEDLADLQALTTRIATSGLTPTERQLFVDVGLTDDDIAGIVTWLSNVPDQLVPGQSRIDLLLETADAMEIDLDEIDAFARHVGSVRIPVPPNQPPIASFTRSPSAGPAPLTVSFDGRSSSDPDGSIVSYQWQFGDGSTAMGATTTHTFSSPAEYGVVLRVTDDGGATDDTIASVTATAAPIDQAPVAAFSLAWSDTVPGLAHLTSVSTDADGTIVDTSWSFGDGETGTGPVVDHVFTPGTFPVQIAVTDDDGLIGTSTGWVTVVAGNLPPVASVVAEADPTNPLTVTFDGSASDDPDGAIVQYLWEFGDGATSDLPIAAHTYAGPGTYTSRLTVTDDDGSTAIAIGSVRINRAPVPAVTIDRSSGTAPLVVRFDAQASSDPDGTIVSYSWDLGDGTIASGPTAQHTYDTPGTYHPVLTVTDDEGATATASGVITVSPNSPPSAGSSTLTTTGRLAFDVLAHASDPDGDAITVGEIVPPAIGTLTCDDFGGCLYVAAPGFVGPVTIDYRSSDGRLDSALATVTVVVTEPAAPPGELFAVDDTVVTTQGVAATVDALANDTGTDIDLTSSTAPEHGTASCTPDGACTYDPDDGYVGTDHFSYVITDSTGRAVTATVRVRVSATADHVPIVSGRAGPPTESGATVERGNDGRWWVGATVEPSGAEPLGTLERDLVAQLSGPHLVRDATITAAPGWTVTHSTSTSIAAHAGADALLGESIVQALPRPASPVSQGTGGDGHVPILVGSRAYAFFHHSSPTSVTCIERSTGLRCPGYPIPLNWNSDNIPGPGAVVGTRIYTRLSSASGSDFSLFCWDTSIDATCGARVLERVPGASTYVSQGSSPVVIDGRVWALGRSGLLHCIVGATGADCPRPSIDTGLRSTGSYFDITTHGDRVYVKGTENLVACIDVGLGRRCDGWSTARQFTTGSDLVTRFSPTGVADGVCLVSGTGGSCIADTGGPATPIGPWPFSAGYYNEQQTADTGTRTFFAALSVAGLGCWDWTTMAPCAGDHFDANGWTSRDVTGASLPSGYGAVWDGTCVVAVGDPGLVYTVASGGASPCSGTGQATRTEPVDLRLQRCSGDVGDATWRDVTATGVDLEPGAELTSLVVLVRDAETGEVVATRELIGTAGAVDLSGVSAYAHPSLALETSAVSVAGDPAWSDGRQPLVRLRWNADPAALCFRTSTVVDCGAAPSMIAVAATIGDRDAAVSLPLVSGATCDPTNAVPTATSSTLRTERDRPIDVELFGADGDGDPILASLVDEPAHGELVPLSSASRALAAPPARFTYVPDPGFVGRDSLTFTVTDGWAVSSLGVVTIEVVAPDDGTTTTTTTIAGTTTTTTTGTTAPSNTPAATTTSPTGGAGVVSPSTPVDRLPATGSDGAIVRWAAIALGAGVLALLGTRRRRWEERERTS